MQKSAKNLFIIITTATLLGTIIALSNRKVNPTGKVGLFVGDSHTAFFGKGWQDILSNMYGFKVVNISKGGIQTSQMLSSLRTYLNTQQIPSMLFIYGGANDIFSNVNADLVINNIQAMVDVGIAKGIKAKNIFVITGYNTTSVTKGSKYATSSFPKRMDTFKKSLQTEIKKATVVSLWEGGTSKDTSDGLHINAKGQAKFAQHIGSEIFS